MTEDVCNIQTQLFKVRTFCIHCGADHDDGVLGVGGWCGGVVCLQPNRTVKNSDKY